MRRATGKIDTRGCEKVFLSTLSLRRATARRASRQQPAGISIHALLAESDGCVRYCIHARGFLSTLSLRRATNGHEQAPYRVWISIHALLAESDRSLRQLQSALRHFYPRSPCGERPVLPVKPPHELLFLSTLSLRRATGQRFHAVCVVGISIHALLAESDVIPPRRKPRMAGFLSTLSLRRATKLDGKIARVEVISIHALLAESDKH